MPGRQPYLPLQQHPAFGIHAPVSNEMRRRALVAGLRAFFGANWRNMLGVIVSGGALAAPQYISEYVQQAYQPISDALSEYMSPAQIQSVRPQEIVQTMQENWAEIAGKRARFSEESMTDAPLTFAPTHAPTPAGRVKRPYGPWNRSKMSFTRLRLRSLNHGRRRRFRRYRRRRR